LCDIDRHWQTLCAAHNVCTNTCPTDIDRHCVTSTDIDRHCVLHTMCALTYSYDICVTWPHMVGVDPTKSARSETFTLRLISAWHTVRDTWYVTQSCWYMIVKWLLHAICDVTHLFTFPVFSARQWTWLIRTTRFYESHVCLTRLTHLYRYVWHDSFTCVTWLIHMCDMTHSYVWQDSLICMTWLIHMCDTTHSYVWHDSFICLTRLTHMYDMTHPYVWHDSFICVTRLIHMCDMTHSYVWHDSLIRVKWLIHMPYVRHESHTCVT